VINFIDKFLNLALKIDFLYPGNETLLNQPLRLLKNFRDVIDIRYKTDYFPIEGKNATKSQDPRYILMEDKSQDTVIKV